THAFRRADAFQPGPSGREFGLKRDVGDIAGQRDVIGILHLQIGDQAVEDGAIMNKAAVAPPVDVAGDPLVHKLAQARPRQRRQMRIGQVGEGEHRLRSCPASCRASTSLRDTLETWMAGTSPAMTKSGWLRAADQYAGQE